MKVVDLNN